MATALRENQGYMIIRGKEKEFFEKLKQSRPGKEFWEECRYFRSNMNEQSIAEMRALMDKED